jgi:peptide/nickel transport system substrate-binding protein
MTSNAMARRPLAAALAGVALLGVVTGCAGQAESSNPASFTFALPAAPISLDIAKDFDGNIMQIMAPVTQKLENVTASGKLTPGLATSVDQPDPQTLVYHLRDGVKFSDGKPLTSADVVWSLHHLTDPGGGAQTAGNAPWIKDITATGTDAVTVTLTQPVAYARASIAVIGFIQEAAFAKAHAKDLGTPTAVPIGTGPYKVTQDTTQQVALRRNPFYHQAQQPAVNQINFTFISQDNTAQLAMRSGSLQGALVGNLKSVAQWRSIKGTSLNMLEALQTTFLTLDTSAAPLNDVHVRKAIAYSIDRAGVMSAGYGKSSQLLQSVAPAGVLTDVAPSAPAAEQFLNSLPRYGLDPAKAKQELAESAYPNGFSLSVPVIADAPYSDLVVQNLAENMKPLHVTITPKTIAESQWVATVYAHAKGIGMQTMDLIPPIPDPSAVLGVVTGKANIRPGGFNLANWSTPVAEAAYRQVTDSTDKATRWQAAKTLLTAIADDVPYIPLFNPDTVVVLGGGFRFGHPKTLFDLDVNGTWVYDLKG